MPRPALPVFAEVRDPDDRRHRYAFTNCTHCGPRLSIVRAIPYDRARTSMAGFGMCGACQAEYDDPADRRFHAQPNACPACGPQLWLEGAGAPAAEPIAAARALLEAGEIVAIKGDRRLSPGRRCDQRRGRSRLRARKRRYDKPFALMARDLEVIGRYCRVEPGGAGAARERGGADRDPRCARIGAGGAAVAPGQRTLGFMLPYTPLHHLLLEGVGSADRADQRQSLRGATGAPTTRRRAPGCPASPTTG